MGICRCHNSPQLASTFSKIADFWLSGPVCKESTYAGLLERLLGSDSDSSDERPTNFQKQDPDDDFLITVEITVTQY